MDQKHAMLYPPINATRSNEHMSASAAIGLPIEAPPSYDVAIANERNKDYRTTTTPATGTGITFGWASSSAAATAPTAESVLQQQHNQPAARPVIVLQPGLPQQQRQPHQMPPIPQQQQSQQQQPQSVITTTGGDFMLPQGSQLGPNPSAVTCPACGTCRTTRMCYTPNSRTHLCALLLCLVGWCCCACCVPYCMNSCRTGNHYCSKCNAFLGSYSPRKGKFL